MTKGDLYCTANGQHRFVLGTTSNGDIAFATRGKNPSPDYDHCDVQSEQTFLSEATFVSSEPAGEVSRVEMKFANYIVAKKVS